jgi:hypothetical protein
MDDTCFYIKTANNLARGLGSTFDGINLTNGYQPLWFFILAAFYFIISFFVSNPAPEMLFRLALFLQHILLFGMFYFIYKSLVILKIQNRNIKFSIIFLVFIFAFGIRNLGMECYTSCFVLSALVWYKAKNISGTSKSIIIKSALFILLGLSRIELFFTLVPVLILYESYDRDLKKYLSGILRFSVPVLAGAALYFGSNYYFFGHFLTVSGSIKSLFPHNRFFDRLLHFTIYGNYEPYCTLNLWFIVIMTAVLFTAKIRQFSFNVKDKHPFYIFMFWTGIGFISFLVLNMSFNYEGLREWYFAAPTMIAAIIFSILISNKKYILYSLVVSLLLLLSAFFYQSRIVINRLGNIYDYALSIKNYVEKNETVLQIDYSGFVGLFSDRKIINGDGLINSFEYDEYVKSARLQDYLEKYHVDYYSTYTGKIDPVEGIVADTVYSSWGGFQFWFPSENIKYKREEDFESLYHHAKSTWYLIKMRNLSNLN